MVQYNRFREDNIMYSSVKRFLKQTSNHDLMVEYASHRIMGEEPPPEISKRIAQALGDT